MERNPKRRRPLTDEDVAHIKAMRVAGITTTQLAHEFDITQSLVSQICLGRVWSRVNAATDPYDHRR